MTWPEANEPAQVKLSCMIVEEGSTGGLELQCCVLEEPEPVLLVVAGAEKEQRHSL